MNSVFTVYYYYIRKSSGSRQESTFMVKADSDLVAFHIAEQQAKGKHPDCTVVIKEVRRR